MIYDWAKGTDKMNAPEGKNFGTFFVEIYTDGTIVGTYGDDATKFFNIHGWLMWAAWGILGFL